MLLLPWNSWRDLLEFSVPNALLTGFVLLSFLVTAVQASSSNTFSSLFGRKPGMSIINVKWGKERIRIQFPDDPAATPLRLIRDKLADHTGLPRDRCKLVKSGAIMKDDNLPLSAYGLKPGSTIALIASGGDVDADAPGSGGASAVGKKEAAGPPTEQSTLVKIQTELESVRTTLQPAVQTFLSTISPSLPPPSTTAADPSTTTPSPTYPPSLTFLSKEPPKTIHMRLGELLLQALLRLDAIVPESEWAEARAARKTAVKEVQGLLDGLDDAWRSYTSKGGPGSAIAN